MPEDGHCIFCNLHPRHFAQYIEQRADRLQRSPLNLHRGEVGLPLDAFCIAPDYHPLDLLHWRGGHYHAQVCIAYHVH